MIILLDLDGVLANFQKGTNQIFDQPEGWYPSTFKTSEELGISDEEFWSAIHDTNFWEELDPYPWAHDLYEWCNLVADEVHFCTAPSYNPDGSRQKVAWIQEHFPEAHRKFALTPRKYLMAGENRLLVDDRPRNVEKFKEHGGRAVLFPQPYNANGKNIPLDARPSEAKIRIVTELER